jgi:pyruvate,water dikinase
LQFIRWFTDLGVNDVPLVGGKNASLGELYRELASAGVQVPNGFAITADAYRDFMRRTGLADTVTASAASTACR